ncbi:MAG: diphosphate--fructose-6-phosphate 1-phosphotransferase [Candidatus Bipolaricaulota bacterium]|nr:MAG: diphosphate--fructose-6-phosphate 1-phosphotransferase [Candidatus Bipolaricaulota bacterium]
MGNALVAQSGGPTAVINASLLGVIDACQEIPSRIDHIYAAHHGIEGILLEELIDLSLEEPEELRLLRTTPAAGAIGTCRYKVTADQREDLERVVNVLDAHGIEFFFYIGGNDSMDTAHRVSELAGERGLDLICAGIPKTIDNDLGDQERLVMDHTPGYGSVARYWTDLIRGLDEENRGSSPADPVVVVQAMGRRIGFIPAAARLADPQRDLPLLIALPEAGLTLEELGDHVDQTLRREGRALVVVSEGFNVGALGERHDAFGHVEFGASRRSVCQAVVNYLNDRGLPVRGSARGQIPGTHQRHAFAHVSDVDLDEASAVGRHAVHVAVERGTGLMATIRRVSDSPYAVEYGHAPLAEMANSERHFPQEWIDASRIDVRDDFVDYARPLLGGRSITIPRERGAPRFARLNRRLTEKLCSPYVPQALRKESR